MPISSFRLRNLVNDSWLNDNISTARDAFNEYQISHCYHPFQVRIFDSHLNQFRFIDVPCGRCYHCKETKVNQWVTRMYAHCEDFKYVYFVTLTYRSFSNIDLPVNRLMLDKLSQAVWHYDNINEFKKYCYSPCLLVKKHYQDFLKRLRKYSDDSTLTYCISGEHGKRFGRPHFHLILFSNNVISYDLVKRAWSFALFNHKTKGWQYKTNQSEKNGKSFYFPIGRVDFHDLVSNGSFNTGVKVNVDGRYLSSANCFAYVCKYVCKGGKFNDFRIRLAFTSIYDRLTYVNCYNNDLPYSDAKKKLFESGISPYNIEVILKKCSYEKVLFNQTSPIYRGNLQFFKEFVFPHVTFKKPIFPEKIYDFCSEFKPFVEFSRGVPIGSIYASRHLQEFTQGIYNRPLLQTQSFVVPSYFRNKAKEFIYGLRKVSKRSENISYVLSNLHDLSGLLHSLCETPSPYYLYSCDSSSSQDLRDIIKTKSHFVDKSTHEHILFPVIDGKVFAEFFYYDRSIKNYVLTRSLPIKSFCDYWLDKLEHEFKRYIKDYSKSVVSKKFEDQAFCILTDLGFDLVNERERFESDQTNYLNHRNLLYDSVHASAE